MIVTTSDRGREIEVQEARALAERWGMVFVPRDDIPADEPVLVVTRVGLHLQRQGEVKRWHPAMLHALRASGAKHPLIRLTDASPGDTVVDCTLGLGTDARFLSEWTGRRVVGLEVVPALAALAADGLTRVGADVDVVLADATAWLADQPDDSVDIVMADPLFPENPSTSSTSLDVIRWAGERRPLDDAWLDEALRVARKAVIVRDVVGNDLLERLGAPFVDEKKHRTTRYGVWRLDGVRPGRSA